MTSTTTGLCVFACVFGAAALAMLVRNALPQHHLSADTKDLVKLSMGLVATMAALVLGLLVASAKGSYDTQKDEMVRMAGKVAFLDRMLAHYGPPQTEAQRSRKEQALALAADVGQMRWLLFEQAGSSISTPLLVTVVLWLALIFFSFGLFAPSNSTAVATLLVAALSVSGAIFLILELDQPFSGLIRISSQPMLNALGQLGR